MVKQTVARRFPYANVADSTLLAQELHFKTSDRKVKNRFFKASMSEVMASFNQDDLKLTGIPSERLINLYSKWAHGGFGVIATGNFIVDHMHVEAAGNVVISKETVSEEKTNQLKRLAKTAKSNGSLVIAQLNHCGRQTPSNINLTPFSASDVHLTKRIKTSFGKPVPLTKNQIKTEVIDRFVFAALQCYEMGFDGIQLHSAHGYLLSQFLSPTTNCRTDEYGGNADNRSRIIEEIYRAIRKEIPPSTGFIVGIKLNSADSPQSGSLDDVSFIAKKIDALGFDFIELSGGSYENWTLFHKKESTKLREAFFLEFSSAIKPYMKNTIVYVTGGFRSVNAMVQAIENDELDGIGLAKPAASETDLARKILEEGVQSASFNHYETDFGMAGLQAQTQMGQAGKSPWEKSSANPCFEITDFSDEKQAAKFKEGALTYLTKVMKFETLQGKPYVRLFEYNPKENYSFFGSSIVSCVFGMYARYIGFKQ